MSEKKQIKIGNFNSIWNQFDKKFMNHKISTLEYLQNILDLNKLFKQK